MKIIEYIFGLIERLHLGIAKILSGMFGWLWRCQNRFPLGLRLAVGFLMLSLFSLALAKFLPYHWCMWAGIGEDQTLMRYLERGDLLAGGVRLRYVCLASAGLAFLAAVLALLKTRLSFRVMQGAWALGAVAACLAFNWTMKVPSFLQSCDHKAFDAGMRNNLWTPAVGAFLVVALALLALLWPLVTDLVRRAYGLKSSSLCGKETGERVLANLKTGGGDPRFRSSLYWTITIFVAILFLPYLIGVWGWEEPYGLPAGGGQQVMQQKVQVKKIKPKKKPKKLTVNPWSPYILERMDIDDVVTLQELEEETRDTYVAENTQSTGGKGKGKGGWPMGVEGSAVRFIRLKYKGGDWDQDMGKGADYNLLLKFHDWTGIKIARETEAREIERLKLFPHKKAPPFVFLTGMGNIIASDAEVRVLRNYCQKEGGMLFIDNGGGRFDSAVKNLLKRVFPGNPLVDIPNDDAIFQRPYLFPDGAPPFWHHAGNRALGIREDGRWLVFYHPGDINDAWKDDHSGASAEVADQAYKLGVNVMFYAFNQYYKRHYEQ